MKKFWTITDAHTEHTNSRSQRFFAYDQAVVAATNRVESGRTAEVVVMEAVAIVSRRPNPIEVTTIPE